MASMGGKRGANESVPMYRARVSETLLAAARLEAAARWNHKNEGTVQTHEYASRTNQGALSRLHLSGSIDADQLAWACEIAMVAETIERDVEVKISKYRMPVDNEGSSKDVLVEGIMRVWREIAYGWWRERIPHPKRAILDMLTGEPVPYSTIALRYRIGHRRARKMLIDAIDLWPEAMEYAEKSVDAADLAAAHAGLL